MNTKFGAGFALGGLWYPVHMGGQTTLLSQIFQKAETMISSSGKEMVKYVGNDVETLGICNFSAGQ